MAKTKAKGKTKQASKAQPKYLGVKLFGGQRVKTGQIIIRQRGTKFIPGKNVKRGKDDTLYALRNGIITFKTQRKTSFNRSKRKVKLVDVVQKP